MFTNQRMFSLSPLRSFRWKVSNAEGTQDISRTKMSFEDVLYVYFFGLRENYITLK